MLLDIFFALQTTINKIEQECNESSFCLGGGWNQISNPSSGAKDTYLTNNNLNEPKTVFPKRQR